MNEIYTRRSTRNFTGAKISKEDLIEIVKSGMNAPSGKNRQAWQFVIFDDAELIDQMVAFAPNWKPLEGAGQGIIVCGDLTINDDPFYNFVDCSAATQNILLKAEEMQYGTCWLGIAPSLEKAEQVRKLFNMPASFLPVNLIAIGMKNEKKESNNRYLSERVHFGKFQS